MAHWVQAVGLQLDPAWRRRPDPARRRDAAEFATALEERGGPTTFCYTTTGLEASMDVLLWRMAPSLDDLQEALARDLRRGMGRWLDVAHSFVGVTAPSPYAGRPQPEVPALFSGERARYLIVYPFTKTVGWYSLDGAARRHLMGEHIRIGRAHPEVRQLLANSFGVDDQDFLVAYETDAPDRFSELVRELRHTAARAYTAGDTPISVGVRRDAHELGQVLGGWTKETHL